MVDFHLFDPFFPHALLWIPNACIEHKDVDTLIFDLGYDLLGKAADCIEVAQVHRQTLDAIQGRAFRRSILERGDGIIDARHTPCADDDLPCVAARSNEKLTQRFEALQAQARSDIVRIAQSLERGRQARHCRLQTSQTGCRPQCSGRDEWLTCNDQVAGNNRAGHGSSSLVRR